MTMETKHFAIEELEVKEDGESRTVEGFASVFNNVDGGKDIVMPGAFTRTLKGIKSVPMLWQHDRHQPIGVWSEFEQNEKGLRVKGTIIDTALGLDAYKLAKAGALKGMSIGYSTKKYEIDATKGVRKLLDVDLGEISLVTFPMNEKATITRVKSQAPVTIREFEECLREVGFSQKDATTIALRGFKALSDQGEPDEEVAKAALSAITNATNILKGFTA